MNIKKIFLCSIISPFFIGNIFSGEKGKQSEPVVLNKGWNTKLDEAGNTVFDYVVADILRSHSYTFPYTQVFKKESDTFTPFGTLRDHSYRTRNKSNKERDELLNSVTDQDAVYCPCFQTTFNRENNEPETIAALILQTRNPQACQQLIEQQKKQIKGETVSSTKTSAPEKTGSQQHQQPASKQTKQPYSPLINTQKKEDPLAYLQAHMNSAHN